MNPLAPAAMADPLASIDNFEAFSRLPEPVRNGVLARLDWIQRIEAAPPGRKGEVVAAAAAALKLSEVQVNRIRREFRDGGWAVLCDGRGRTGGALPDAFKVFVRQLHFNHQRATTGKEVQRVLLERWQLWRESGEARHALPGYDAPPPAGANGIPAGWSDDTLTRLRPAGYELATVRQGAKSAAKFLPGILKTRVGLRFGQVVFCDDEQFDVKVAPRGAGQKPLRPEGFSFLDYLSGCFMHHVIRLRWWDKAGDQYRTLSQMDFTWALVGYLQKTGYRADEAGTCLVMEHGTASGYDNAKLSTFGGWHSLDEALAGVSGGKITVARSGLFNKPAFAGMLFRPQSSGNPNLKGPLESMFSLVRSRMAALPGATGRNRDLKPAEQHGLDLYTGQLLKLWDRLDARHREAMVWPVLTAEKFGEVADAVFAAINARTDHNLEGWAKLGFVVSQLRWTPDERSPWYSNAEAAALPAAARAGLEAMAGTPGCLRSHRLAPAEVARQHEGELTKLADHLVPLLIPREWARPVTVKENRTIAIQDQLLGAEAFTYVCRFTERDSARVIAPGTKLLAYLNPFAPERLVICREDGAYLGTLDQQTRAAFMDSEAIVDQLKGRSELKADLDTGVRPHLAGEMAARQEMKRVNARLANGEPVLPEEVAAARAESARDGVRTRKANEISAALGGAALNPALLLDPDDADDAEDLQAPCMAAAGAFSAAQFLTQTTEPDEY